MIDVPPAYSPALAPSRVLDELVVGRDAIIQTLVSNLASTVRDGGARFELLAGPAGSGKTHLLQVIAHRLSQAVADRAAIVSISGHKLVSSLPDLFRRILLELSAILTGSDGDGATPRASNAAGTLPFSDAADALASEVDDLLGSRPLVVFVEELGELLEASEASQAALRAHLQNRGCWSIVTTGRSVSPAFVEARSPFFGSFAIRRLAPLDDEACRSLLSRRVEARAESDEALVALLRSPSGLARVRALRHLFGGWPRPFALLEPLLDEKRLDDLVELTPRLADAFLPHLSAVQERLPFGRRAIFDLLLDHGRPLNVNEISAALFGVTPQNAASQLGLLRRSHLVRVLRLGRESFHEIADPVHRVVGLTQSAPTQLEALIRFLRSWYDEPAEHRDPDLGAFGAERPGRVLLDLDLAASGAIDRKAVDATRAAAVAWQEHAESYDRAAKNAVRQIVRASAAERPVLTRCLEGIGAADIVNAVPAPSYD